MSLVNLQIEKEVQPIEAPYRSKENQPLAGETPLNYAYRLSKIYSGNTLKNRKKELGQYFTPVEIAEFMANLAKSKKEQIKILDPGCGTGVLSCALVQELTAKNENLKEIELTAYETDVNIIGSTFFAYNHLYEWAASKGIILTYNIIQDDFILSNYTYLKEKNQPLERPDFDFIISNPPFFKISADDIRAVVSKELVHGQPNIYAIFLGISAKLLNKEGQLIFINPRSFTSGYYFKLFREKFFKEIQLEYIHVFESRKDAFKKDSTLQELIILKGTPRLGGYRNKIVSVSHSYSINDLKEPKINQYDESELIDIRSKHKILYLPVTEREKKVINLFRTWNGNLEKYNINISTGPVVAFRAIRICNRKLHK